MIAKAQRHRQIIKLIESGRITSQSDLAQQLARIGIDTTQTTLSRDLTEIGVVKSAAGYQILSANSEAAPIDRIASLTATVRRLLLEVAIGGTQAIVHTPPGQASALAVEIDRATLPGVLGTIAGDDCIFIACTTNNAAKLVARRLQSISQGSPTESRTRESRTRESRTGESRPSGSARRSHAHS